MAENIHPEHGRFLKRTEKEALLKQRGTVCWLYGLSGSGKSTIANEVERQLYEEGRVSVILDGDNLRAGLNKNLGFTDEDRFENVRRTAEVAKIFAQQGLVTLVSVITPRRQLRELARELLGGDFFEVYVKADFETCQRRDPKGLYKAVADGKVKNFTGKDSLFEEPESPNLILDTETNSVAENVKLLLQILRDRSRLER